MATREEFLTRLASYIGTTESPPNSNCQRFSKALGRPCEYWCADYVAAVAKEVGLTLPSYSAYTPTVADAFRLAGRWTHQPAPGLLGLVDFPGDNHHGIQHILVVEAVLGGGRIQTLEGNTSSGDAGSQDNGGGVYRRVRPQAWVVGYGIPAFDEVPPPKAPGGRIVPEEEIEMAVVVDRPQGGYIIVQHDGGVFQDSEGVAPYRGSIPEHPDWKVGGNVVGGAWTESGEGYWLVTRDGAVYSFGDAEYRGGFNGEPPEVRGARFAVGIVAVGHGYHVVTFDPSGDETRYDPYAYGV